MRGRAAESFRWNDGIKRKEIRRARRGSVLILTEIEVRKRESGGETEGERESPKECDSERNKTIDRRGYQRNKGTAGGKVRAILAKKSLVKEVGRGLENRKEEKKIPSRKRGTGKWTRIVSALSGNATNKEKAACPSAVSSSLVPITAW